MTGSLLELRVAWQHHLGQTPLAGRWFDAVVARYSEPHRHYHNVRHLRWVNRHVAALTSRTAPADHAAVIAAAFFHDAIYDPLARDNEAASGRLAARALTELGWGTTRVEHVEAMIVGTGHHDISDVDVDHAVLYAADLAVLAAEPAGYSDYVRNVRREYHHVTDAEWVTGRGAVLQGFLDRAAIFSPALDVTAWEQRARGNLTSELDGLRGRV